MLAGGDKSLIPCTQSSCLQNKHLLHLKDRDVMSFWHKSDAYSWHSGWSSLTRWKYSVLHVTGAICVQLRDTTECHCGHIRCVLAAQLDVIRPGWRGSTLCVFPGKHRPITLGKYWLELREQPSSLPLFPFPVSPQGSCDEAFPLNLMLC